MPADNSSTPTTSTSVVAPELQALPLELIITGAMNGIVSAQAISANTTANFLENTKGDLTFNAQMDDGGVTKNMSINVPKLAVVPIPSLRVDAATIHFNFEIKQFSSVSSQTDFNANMNVGTTGWLKNIVSASLSGSVAHKSATESTINRSGMLDVTIHLSEPALPEGLNKVLSLLSNAIIVTDAPPAIDTNPAVDTNAATDTTDANSGGNG